MKLKKPEEVQEYLSTITFNQFNGAIALIPARVRDAIGAAKGDKLNWVVDYTRDEIRVELVKGAE